MWDWLSVEVLGWSIIIGFTGFMAWWAFADRNSWTLQKEG